MITIRKKLRPIHLAGGEIQRTLVTVGREPIVLFEKSHPVLRPKQSPTNWGRLPDEGCGPAIKQLIAPWNQQSPLSFNCHTFAIGSFVGLQPRFWLEGARSVFALMENPAQTLLDAFFYELDRASELHTICANACDDDVLVLRRAESDDLTHSGVIRCQGNRVLVVSKFGEQPLCVSPPAAVEHEYRGQYDSVHLFRCKQETLRRPRPRNRKLRLMHESAA